MNRKAVLLAIGIVLLLIGGSVTALFLLVRHEPEVYRRAAVAPGPERQQQSKDCVEEFTALITGLQSGSDEPFDVRLTDAQINSYFAEGFKQQGLEKLMLPEGISEPRVVFEPGNIRLAFRYGSGLWSSVITVDFGVWLTRQPNVVGLKLLNLQAGSLPIGAQTLLDNLSEMIESNGVQIDWYRHDGHPVALLRFQNDQRDNTVQLQDLQVHQGSIVIRGKPVEPATTRSASLPDVRPVAGN